MRTGVLRVIGAATAVYGVAVARWPALLARPSGLTDPDGRPPEGIAVSLRPLAWRDAVSGTAMLLAPDGAPLVLATLVRVGADLGDAVLLGRTLPDRGRRPAVVAVSVGWGALSLAALLSGGRTRRRRLPAAAVVPAAAGHPVLLRPPEGPGAGS